MEIKKMLKETDTEKQSDKIEKMRNTEIKKMLFDPYIREATNESNGIQPITSFFQLKK